MLRQWETLWKLHTKLPAGTHKPDPGQAITFLPQDAELLSPVIAKWVNGKPVVKIRTHVLQLIVQHELV